MASESSKQSAWLAKGRADKYNRTFSNTTLNYTALEEVFIKYGRLFIEGFQTELNKQSMRGGKTPKLSDAVGSGLSSSSMSFNYEKFATSYSVTIFMQDYLKFVDLGVQGVNPTENLNTQSPYKFKFINPSKAHVDALEKWIKEKNVVASVTVPKGIKSELQPRDLAYIIGRSIKTRGIRPLYFKEKVIERLINDFKIEVAKAVPIDIQVNILF